MLFFKMIEINTLNQYIVLQIVNFIKNALYKRKKEDIQVLLYFLLVFLSIFATI